MKKILNIIKEILFVIAYGSGMTLVVIGSRFSVLELVLIATCAAILHIGLSKTLKNLEGD